MTSREIVRATLRFESSERIPYDLAEPWGSDIMRIVASPHPDYRPQTCASDEWGVAWWNIGNCEHGEVREYPLKEWSDFERLSIPDPEEPTRWHNVEAARGIAKDKYLLGTGVSIWERAHFLRGLQNAWMDIHINPEELGILIDLLTDMNLKMIERYAAADYDGYLFSDDWGLQERLMISPDSWREIWKPRYARIVTAVHEAGMQMFLHSCGYIVDIIDDLIEIGLDALHMDQQENMGLDTLGERFGGRITFFSPVDSQRMMSLGSTDNIRKYARRMAHVLGRPEGGFIPRWYTDPVGAGHSQEALDAMCSEFKEISAHSTIERQKVSQACAETPGERIIT